MDRTPRIAAYAASLGATLLAFATIGAMGGGYTAGPLTLLAALGLAPFMALITAFWYPFGARYLRRVRDEGGGFPSTRVWGPMAGITLLVCAPAALLLGPELAVYLLVSLLAGAAAYLGVLHSVGAAERG